MPKHLWTVDTLLEGSWRGASCVLLCNNGHRAIVDTGMTHEEPQIVEALRRRGLTPLDITTVINTHFHVDHVLNNCIFSKADIYASQQSYDWARALYSDLQNEADWEKLTLKYYPETREYAESETHMHKLRKLALRWWNPSRLGNPDQFRWIERQSLPDGLEPILTFGHVPGHISILASNGPGDRTVIAGDALLSSGDEHRVLTMIPHDKGVYRSERAKLLEGGGRIIPGHGQDFAAEDEMAATPTP